ncbi:MAG: hypothetical protein LBB83_06100 [Treponema sp.]|jgi:hypothetical protein|nr:hypothetical protein [Treponema sp.]
MRRPYISESAIRPGTGVVQGSAENTVKAPGSGGSGDFLGVYAWEANQAKEAGDKVGIALSGVEKVQAGGEVTAGKKAVLKGDTSGTFIDIGTAAGRYATCGTFLESGAAGQYVDMIIERGSVTIPA